MALCVTTIESSFAGNAERGTFQARQVCISRATTRNETNVPARLRGPEALRQTAVQEVWQRGSADVLPTDESMKGPYPQRNLPC